MFTPFCLVYVRRFLNHTIVFFGVPFDPAPVGSRLVRLMVALALIETIIIEYWFNYISFSKFSSAT